MIRCYLCGNDASIEGRDYGRRKIVFCESNGCGLYEITNSAIAILEDKDCPEYLKKQLCNQTKHAKENNKEFEIFYDDSKQKLIGRPK